MTLQRTIQLEFILIQSQLNDFCVNSRINFEHFRWRNTMPAFFFFTLYFYFDLPCPLLRRVERWGLACNLAIGYIQLELHWTTKLKMQLKKHISLITFHTKHTSKGQNKGHSGQKGWPASWCQEKRAKWNCKRKSKAQQQHTVHLQQQQQQQRQRKQQQVTHEPGEWEIICVLACRMACGWLVGGWMTWVVQSGLDAGRKCGSGTALLF